MNIKNKKGAALSGGMVLLILAVAVAAYMFIPAVQEIFQPAAPVTPPVPSAGRCPSSGLTEITLNTQEALASTATNANVAYYAFDNGVLVKEGSTGTDGTVSFDLGCAVGQKYTVLVLNETVQTGFYPKTITVDASGPTDVHNMKLYEFGGITIANLGSSVDPAEVANVSGGVGKTCGIILTFAVNETASGYNKPLIMCQANISTVSNIHFNGVTRADAKAPVRVSSYTGWSYWTFELDRMLESTEGAVKLTGTIEFGASAPVNAKANNLSCVIVDQSTFKVAEYKTLSLSDGFLEAAENTETRAEIGAPDSDLQQMFIGQGTYC